jgi:hypothetical protein
VVHREHPQLHVFAARRPVRGTSPRPKRFGRMGNMDMVAGWIPALSGK